jgi:hypothetical protein
VNAVTPTHILMVDHVYLAFYQIFGIEQVYHVKVVQLGLFINSIKKFAFLAHHRRQMQLELDAKHATHLHILISQQKLVLNVLHHQHIISLQENANVLLKHHYL